MLCELTISLIFSHCLLPLIGIEIPKCDGITCSMCRLYFMRVSSIRPEEGYSIKNRLNVGDSIRPAIWEDTQKTAALRRIPVHVQVIYARYTASISVGVIHMFYIMRALSFVTSDHRLKKTDKNRRSHMRKDYAINCT